MGRFVQDSDGAKGVELMFARTRTVVLVLLAIVAMHSAPAQEGGTSLPDKQQVEFYRDYAVISTTCQTWDEAYALAKRIVEKGGVVSTLLSPQRMLGWVPDSVRPAINGLDRISAIRTTVSMQKETAGGLYADNVSAGLDYFNNAKLGTIAKSAQSSLNAAGSSTATCLDGEDDVVLSSFLSQLGRMSDSAAKAQNVPAEVWQGRMKDSVQSLLGIPRGIMKGVIAVEVFMLESTGAGATHNWSTADERAQIAQTVRMFDFWSRRAAEYGHTLMFRGTWYRPSATTVVNVTGEPISMDKADDWRLIRQVMTNLGYANPFGDPGWGWVGSILTLGICLPCDLAAAWSVFPDGTEKEFVRVMKWNDRRSEEMRVDQTISLFIKLQPAGTDHRAYARSAGSGYVGGRVYIPELHINIDLPDMVIGPYAVLGTREGAPVIAHETAHLFGAPDEYRENTGDTDCPQPGYWFRGTPNRNCIVTNPTSVRALMRNNTEINFTNNELSGATPVFIGWTRPGIHGATTFSTNPAGIPITMDVGFESGSTFIGPRQIELAQGFTIPAVSVPPFVDISGTRYYFDAWYERAPGFSGVFTRTAWGATRSVRRDTAVAAYEARYTTTGGGITTANNTLEARLGMGPAVSGTRERIRTTGIVLVWRNTLSGSGGQYIPQQYLTGVWTDIPAGYYFAGSAAPGYWYAELSSAGIRDGSVNYFRVVPATAAGARGTPSNEVTIVTRNSTPLEDRYGSDIHEPNNTGASATPIAFNGSTDSSKTLDAAITYDALEEFGFSFDTDHYSLSSTALGGQSLRVTIMPKQGSIFHPYVTYKATAAAPAIEARRSVSGGWYFDVSSEGVSTFVVTSRRGSSDLIDFSTGIGNWGEYTITVRPVPPMLGDLSRLCPECRSIARIPAGGGRIYPFGTGIPAQRLFTQAGFPVSAPVPFGYIADADPGFEFKGWEGDLGGSKNPESRSLNPKTDLPGEHLLIAKFSPLPQGQYELVYDVPEAWKSVLGESKRTRGAMDEEFDIELPEAAMNGFDFLGWEGTLTASDIVAPSEWKVSPRIRVKLTRHLWVRPLIVPRPCAGGNPQAFTHALWVTSAKNDATILTYGMQAGAGDGLEAGQVELPPPPPTDIHDARFLNIDGAAQGSLTDVRAITPAHTFVGKVQPGDAGNPVRFAWAPIPASLPGTFLLTAGATLVNMRSTTSMTADLGSSSSFTIQVTQDTCRELPRTEITVAVSDVDATNFPFIRGRACVTDKQGNPVMTVRPSDVMLFEKKGGDRAPGILRAFRPADDCYIFEGFIDNSTPQDNAHKQRSFVLTVGIPNPSGQDEEEVTITLPVPDPGTETGNDNGKPNTAYKVQHGAGWQLVSMPVMLADSRVNSVFGDGSVRSALFGFDTERGYISTDALAFGKGYWLRFAGTGEGRVNGTERTIFEVRGLPGVGQAPADGWNLIGGISYDVPLSAITQSPANAIISLFEFNNGYKPATVLKPGLGYWVKLRADASLRLVKPFTGERGGGASKISGSATPHDGVLASIPRSATLTVSDASGSRAELFFAPASAIERLGSDERVAAELPPAPPTTAFDARFASDFSFAADQGAATLRLQGSPPWVLAFDGSAGDAGTWEVSFSDGAFIASIDARSGGNASIPRPFDGTSSARILLRKSTPAQAAPSAFVLGQNYPNPFSVSATSAGAGTRITYEIASEENVTITVYDALGRAVRGLVRRTMTPGRYTTFWDGRDESGYEVPAGSYLYELRAGAVRRTNHMIVVK